MAVKRRQQGFTLIELMVALIVAISLIGLAATIMEREARRSRNENSAEWLRIVASGAKAYRNANKDALIAAAGPSTPVVVTAAQVQPFLPGGFSLTNAHGQTFQVRFIEPAANQLDGIVLTFNGDNLDTLDQLQVAASAKGGAGYINAANTAEARGPNGNWTRSLASFGGGGSAGKLAYALFYDDVTSLGGAQGDFLSRVAVAGKPELNRMSTAIDMANNDLNNAAVVRAREGVFGAISIGSGLYGASWAYETFGLPAGNNFRFNIGGTEQMSIMGTGTVNVRTGLAAPTVDATYVNSWDVRAGGGVYAGVRIDSPTFNGTEYYADGWFRSNGPRGWYSQTYGGGWHMTDSTWIRAYNGKSIYTTGDMQAHDFEATRNVNAASNVSAGLNVNAGRHVIAQERLIGGYLTLQERSSAGASCPGLGYVSVTSSGEVLSCVGGVWTAPGGLQDVISVISPSRSQGNYWVYATCPAGYKMTGGGHVTAYMQKASSPEGPQESRPIPEANAWGVRSGGGANTETGVNAYAVCVR